MRIDLERGARQAPAVDQRGVVERLAEDLGVLVRYRQAGEHGEVGHIAGAEVQRARIEKIRADEFGKPFFICERFEGAPPGEYFGLWTKCPGAMRDLAQALGRLHAIAPADLGLDADGADASALLTARIDTYWKSWRDNSTRGSPLIDYAFAWSREQSLKPYSAPGAKT